MAKSHEKTPEPEKPKAPPAAPAEPAPAVPEPSSTPPEPAGNPTTFREAFDVVEKDGAFQVLRVTYGNGLSEEHVVFESSSGPLATQHFLEIMKKRVFKAMTGNEYPEAA